MDFLSYIRDQNEKLTNRGYVKHLWNEIDENPEETDISSSINIDDFNNHLPVLLEQFWEAAVEKISSETTFQEIDEELKIYLLVLLYQCMTQSQEHVSINCLIYASEVYLHLLTTPQSGSFFKNKLYRSVLATLQSSLTNSTSKLCSKLVYKLRNYLSKAKLKTPDLEVTLATVLEVIFATTKTGINSFDLNSSLNPSSIEAFLCLKVLLVNEMNSARKFLIITYLFNGLREHNISANNFNMIQVNLRRLMKDLKEKFKDDDYRTFLNAFIHVWKHPSFAFYGEAVMIMNSLKEKHYRSLTDVLNKMLMSKNPPKSLFRFSLAIISNPPTNSVEEKVKVNNEILIRNILTNCLSNKNETANAALDALSSLLTSTDLNRNYIKEPVQNLLNGENVFNVSVVLRGLKSLMNKKWTSKSRNKNLFAVSLSVMLLSEREYPALFGEILEILSEEASPFDLKSFLPLLSEAYIQMCSKQNKSTAFQLLKVIFKMALHPMASSTEFVKYLYMAMVCPSVVKGVTVKSEYFITPLISKDFNFTEFFQKCHTLGIIKKEHVITLMNDLYTVNESNLRVTCAIVHLTEYKELSPIAEHVNDNFLTVCNHPNMTYLLYIYNKILQNCSNLSSNLSVRSNEIMACFIKQHLLKQSFRWNCVANAFALLVNLKDYTNLEEDFMKLKEEYEKSFIGSLRTNGSFLPMLYYSQLVVFGKIIPSEESLAALRKFLILCADDRHRRSPEFNAKLWIGCLLLYTNICVVRSALIDSAIDFLQNGLNCPLVVVKLVSLNLMFDLCNMVTHSFEDLIKYMFKQIIFGDSVFKKTCLLKIDRLIRDDYLKLELTQYTVLVSILGHRNFDLSDYLKRLFSENFFMSNVGLISKNFAPLIVHLSGYKKHPVYTISPKRYELIAAITKDVVNRRKVYSLLMTNLPIKDRFNLIRMLSVNILEKNMKGEIKFDDGYWRMIKDAVYVFKLISSNSDEDESCEEFYEKSIKNISKYILSNSEFSEKRKFPEFQREISQGTETILKLLFYNDSESIQMHIRISVFDAIMHWTQFLMADIVHLVHDDRVKGIQNYYAKVERFFKKNVDILVYSEESYERDSSIGSVGSSSSLFSSPQQYIPDFDS